MNKSQKVVITVFLILMGIVSFTITALIVYFDIEYYLFGGFISMFLAMLVLSIIFTGAGILVFISKKGK